MPEGVHDKAVSGHLSLCLWDLGMAEPVEEPAEEPVEEPVEKPVEEPVEASDDGGATRHVMRLDHEALERWVDEVLRPFEQPGRDGRLARAALFCLRLAALRTGVVSGPDKPSLAQLLDHALWTETPP